MPIPSPFVRQVSRVGGGPGADSDSTLLGRFAGEADAAAFAPLVDRHGPMVLRVCKGVLGHEQDAEDAFQAVFLTLARKAGAVRKQESLAAFLHGVSLRVARKALAARIAGQGRPSRLASPPSPRTPEPDPLDVLTARDLMRVLDEEIQRLPQPYRAPLLLCCLEGSSQEEAAARLGWTAGALRGRLQRGRALLQARLTRRGLTLGAALPATLLPPTSLSIRLARATVGAALAAAVSPSWLGLKVGAVVSLGVLLLIASIWARRSEEKPPAKSAPAPTPRAAGTSPRALAGARMDLDGDPLPPEALARMGSKRFGRAAAAAFAPDGKSFASCNGDFLHWWDVATRRQRSFRLTRGDHLRQLAFAPDGKRVLALSGSHVTVLDLATGRPAISYGRSLQPMPCFALSGDGKTLAAATHTLGGKEHLIRCWPLGSRREGARLAGHTGAVAAVALSHDGGLLASASRDGTLRLWNAKTGKQLLALPLPTPLERFARPSLLLAPDGRTVFLADARGANIHRWDAGTGKPLPPLQGHTRAVCSLAFLDRGRSLLSGGADGALRLWDLAESRERRRLPFRWGTPATLAPAPDGRSVLVGGGVLRRLDLLTGRESPPRRGHEAGCGRWRCPPTAGCWPPPVSTKPCACGRRPRAARRLAWRGSTSVTPAWPGLATAQGCSPPAPKGPSSCATPEAKGSGRSMGTPGRW
jgi:RNA polymerase sigma factor (sigma-70 family)